MSHVEAAAFRGRLGNILLAPSHSGRLLLLSVPRLWCTCVIGPEESSVNREGGGMGESRSGLQNNRSLSGFCRPAWHISEE